ncbi:hypothetical protein QS257_04380 [Terrilactibacillus sp. S3-3]|jgi:hypothetical protein|uniref:hypothetical protein n=1 Tax=Bacillales TaxID=1385 RepID=UPI0015C5E54B|nr:MULTISPECIES: hypothetical protein [Bacillaceae]WKB36375.1 hypothetical protein QS257_04380 [Terrilactibacillus sp. S3-3]MED1419381.1 hypothetical protein [Bacillus smithii]MED1456569.1 hypothetical protein [Bacillus smithii]QPG52980.1 hypothetical protein IR208_13540 [Heyndrickxia coagulans]WNE61003.1 hypothetical protein KIY57_14005 [Heyndrickxia coagulans]
MEEIRDCKGRIACKGNATTGLVEVLYKRCKTSTQIPIGGTLRIEREGVVTIVTRLNDSAFHVESHVYAA